MAGPIAYLDHNATTALRPEARAAMVAALDGTGNASSVHAAGRRARALVEGARDRIAARIGAAPGDLVLTSGGTEANNLALRGSGAVSILISAVEHDSVREAAPEAVAIPVDGRGIVDLDALDAMLKVTARPALVSVMLANNETGALQPVAEVARIAHRHGALCHTDAVQAVGRIPVDMAALGVDLMSLSAHKLGGPQGVGALALRPDLALAPMLRGGHQERGRRAGTENVAAIAGFGAAALSAEPDDGAVERLRDRLETRLRAEAPEAVVLAADAPRLPNTICIALPGVPAETQVMALDLDGVAVGAGAACSSGKVRLSPALVAMNVDPEVARAAIRISLGWSSTAADVDRCAAAWTALRARARGRRRAA